MYAIRSYYVKRYLSYKKEKAEAAAGSMGVSGSTSNSIGAGKAGNGSTGNSIAGAGKAGNDESKGGSV